MEMHQCCESPKPVPRSSRGVHVPTGKESGMLHPCMNFFKGTCKFGERCFFKELPREWCMLCLLGETHDKCKGIMPELHPCIRVWGKCKYAQKGDCVFAKYPRVWCLFCLRGAQHRVCSGIKPKIFPEISNEVTAQCAEHEKKVLARQATADQLGELRTDDQPQTTEPQDSCMVTMIPATNDNLTTLVHQPYAIPQAQQVQVELPNRAAAPFNSVQLAEDTDSVAVGTRKVVGLLNRLTPQKFASLVEQLSQTISSFTETCSESSLFLLNVAKELFTKAIAEPQNVGMYAQLLVELERRLVEALGSDRGIQIRKVILTQSHRLFYAVAAKDFEDDRHRDRVRANVKFLGELYLRGCVTINIMKEVIKNLIHKASVLALNHRAELLVAVLETCGSELERRQAIPLSVINEWYVKLGQHRNQVDNRVGFMIENLLQLRANGWLIPQSAVEESIQMERSNSNSSNSNRRSERSRKPSIESYEHDVIIEC